MTGIHMRNSGFVFPGSIAYVLRFREYKQHSYNVLALRVQHKHFTSA